MCRLAKENLSGFVTPSQSLQGSATLLSAGGTLFVPQRQQRGCTHCCSLSWAFRKRSSWDNTRYMCTDLSFMQCRGKSMWCGGEAVTPANRTPHQNKRICAPNWGFHLHLTANPQLYAEGMIKEGINANHCLQLGDTCSHSFFEPAQHRCGKLQRTEHAAHSERGAMGTIPPRQWVHLHS